MIYTINRGDIMENEEIFERFMNGINGFTDDFFEDGRYGNIQPDERESL